MRFSIIVPTYNEEKDITDTLDSLVNLSYPDREIIVVDDSSDATPEIVKNYADRGVRLIRPQERKGRCEARNIGIIEASGEIVVILNADVRLPKDFLDRIKPYYEDGYDYVLVKSKVENTDELFARYVESMGIVDHYKSDPQWMEWTEGFSCRREIAINAGLFPSGFAVPICAGEDGFFGENLKKSGAKKKIDLSIVVSHVAPATFDEYWSIRKGRGKGSAQIRRFLDQWSFEKMYLWALLRVFKTSVYTIFVIPMLWICTRAALTSPRGLWDVFPFCYAWFIEQSAFHVGELKSIREIRNAESK